jgi:hypothetical protein
MPLDNASVTPDGTVDTAAQMIANARTSEPPAEAAPQETVSQPGRAADGKFQKPETDGEQKPAEAQEPEAGGEEDDEEYLELETTDPETKEAKKERHKLADVWEGYRKSKDLETELQKAKTSQPLPDEYEKSLSDVISERTNYKAALEQWSQFNPVQPPNFELVNPASANYNPEEFYRQKLAFDEGQANHAKVKSEIERVQKLNDEQSSALHQSKLTREMNKLNALWPELKDKATAEKVGADLEKHYGIDGATLKSVIDHRFYALAKDALAFRTNEAAKKEAVKVVREKPKLVRAAARGNSNSKQAQFQGAFGKLQQSHSVEDAAAAISALRQG